MADSTPEAMTPQDKSTWPRPSQGSAASREMAWHACMHWLLNLVLICYAQGGSYRAAVHLDVCYQLEGGPVNRFNRRFGLLPIMVKSEACYLCNMDRLGPQCMQHCQCACSLDTATRNLGTSAVMPNAAGYVGSAPAAARSSSIRSSNFACVR